MPKIKTQLALWGLFNLLSCSAEDDTSSNKVRRQDADALADVSCKISAQAFPALPHEAYLQSVVLTDSLNQSKSLCDFQKELSASSVVMYSLVNKSNYCEECWAQTYQMLENSEKEDKLDLFIQYVRADAEKNLDDLNVKLTSPFGILQDRLAHLTSLLTIHRDGKLDNAILLVDRDNNAIWMTQDAISNASTRSQVLDELHTFLKQAPASGTVDRESADAIPSDSSPEPETTEEDDIKDPIAAGLATISIEAMKKELSYISDDKLLGRLSGTAGQKDAAEYFKQIITAHNVKPLSTAFEQTFSLSNGPLNGKPTSNIIVKIEGNDPILKNEYIVIGAHLDHAGSLDLGYTCSAGTSAGDRICNGADDNGSGSVTVLNVMKAVAKVQKTLKRSVLFFWFSGEEEGLLGSYYYVNQKPIVPLSAIKYMINLDMVGYIHTNGNRLGALGGQTSTSAANILKEIDQKYNYAIQITSSAGGGSDHVPFMGKGIPGVFFHTGVSNNTNYHRTGDSQDKVSYEGMVFAAQTSFELLYRMANAGSSSFASAEAPKVSFITEEEKLQSCHHLMNNPYVSIFSRGVH